MIQSIDSSALDNVYLTSDKFIDPLSVLRPCPRVGVTFLKPQSVDFAIFRFGTESG